MEAIPARDNVSSRLLGDRLFVFRLMTSRYTKPEGLTDPVLGAIIPGIQADGPRDCNFALVADRPVDLIKMRIASVSRGP